MIYLDYHATTPVDPRVVEAMTPYFTEHYGNPSSSIHHMGEVASDAVERARIQVAELLCARPKEVLFTSGATESNNLALMGLAAGAHREGSTRLRIVTSAIEHKSVLGQKKMIEDLGFELLILPVQRDGTVDLEAAEEVITDNTLVVSIQAASNEIGTIQPIPRIAELARAKGSLVHCDAAQAVGKIPVAVNEWGVDLLSASAHKLYGPKGIGALYIRGGPYALPIQPLVVGGGQEYGIRPGTLNVPGIVGFGKACEICEETLDEEHERIASLRDRLEHRLIEEASAERNGFIGRRLAGNCSLTFKGIDAEALIASTPELAISTGSACASGAPEPSHVLLAIGLTREDAYSTVRFGLGRFTVQSETDTAADLILDAVSRLHALREGTKAYHH